MHPHLLQMKMVFTVQDLVEQFHNNAYYHIGHLIVMFAVPLIIISMVGIMNMLQIKAKNGDSGSVLLEYLEPLF